MGMLLVATIFRVEAPPIGVPLHLPFYFLVLLLSTIQATVFSLLTAIYIMQLQPHEHHEEHGEAHGDAHADHGAQPSTQGAVI